MKCKLKKRMFDLVRETVNHYNSLNRCTKHGTDDLCLYVPEDGDDATEGCAVGRKLPEEYKNSLLKHQRFESLNSDPVNDLFSDLGTPEIFKDIPVIFLGDLQAIHDEPGNWNEKGITEEGRRKANKIMEDIKLGEYN